MDNITYQPVSVGIPGDIVVEYLESMSWTQKDLALRAGITPKLVSELCSGKARITPPTSLALERTLGRPAHFWLNLQARYDEAEARKRENEESAEWLNWAKQFPISEMKKRGWIPNVRGINTGDILKYLGVSSPNSWEEVWKTHEVSYRQTRLSKPNDYAIYAWLRAVEIDVGEKNIGDFDDKLLMTALGDIRRCTRLRVDEALKKVDHILSRCGVALSIIPALPNTGISGCTRWTGKNKVIVAITLRYKWDDQIWFTLFHELGHVLLHRKKHTFILDNPEDKITDSVIDPSMQAVEEEANRFAADTIIPPQLFNQFISFNVFGSEYIQEFADAIDISPGLVVGRLQHEGILKPHMGNKLKQRVQWSFTES